MKSQIRSIFLVCALSTGLGISSDKDTVPAASVGEKPPCCRKLEASKPLPDASVYQLTSTWTSDVGRDFNLQVLQGRIQVTALFFASCEYACPVTVHTLKLVQESLPDSLKDKVDFLLISFDSERDTPAVLHEYRERMQLDTAHWTLARGEPDDVREIAALLGVNYRKDQRGQFAHSNLITILGPQGEVAQQFNGLQIKSTEIAQALAKISKN
jgi:protein SCO1/2